MSACAAVEHSSRLGPIELDDLEFVNPVSVPRSEAGGESRSHDAGHDDAGDRDGGGIPWQERHYAGRRGRPRTVRTAPYWPHGRHLT